MCVMPVGGNIKWKDSLQLLPNLPMDELAKKLEIGDMERRAQGFLNGTGKDGLLLFSYMMEDGQMQVTLHVKGKMDPLLAAKSLSWALNDVMQKMGLPPPSSGIMPQSAR